MIFGRQPQGHTAAFPSILEKSVRRRMRGVWWLFATLLVIAPLAILGTGCGSSSSSGPGQGSTNRNARVSGRLVDEYNSNAPVAGATVHVGGLSALSGTDGTFSIAVASGQGTVNLTVDSPAAVAYYNTGK